MNIPFFVFVEEIGLKTALWVSSVCSCCGKSLLVRSCNLASSADGLVYRLRRNCFAVPFESHSKTSCCFLLLLLFVHLWSRETVGKHCCVQSIQNWLLNKACVCVCVCVCVCACARAGASSGGGGEED
jgi:hypothetical protein